MSEPELLEVTRGALVESRHSGSFVVLDASGAVTVAGGAIDAPVYARSSLKPLQAATMLAAGFAADGPSEHVALAAASHDGEDVHLSVVRAILAGAGLDESALRCPPDLPSGRDALLAWVSGGGGAAAICHNCSGKHAAMVATCVVQGWDVGSYLSATHPLQLAIRDGIERSCGEPIAATSVDGCGAPAHAVTLGGLARGFASVAGAGRGPGSSGAGPGPESVGPGSSGPGSSGPGSSGPGSAAGTVAAAMRAHPRLIGGTGRPVTELAGEVGGLVAKDGAEGVWAAALPDGRAFAAKISDGSARALGPLLATVLRYWGADGPAVRRWADLEVRGGGRPVGVVRAAPEFRALLGL